MDSKVNVSRIHFYICYGSFQIDILSKVLRDHISYIFISLFLQIFSSLYSKLTLRIMKIFDEKMFAT